MDYFYFLVFAVSLNIHAVGTLECFSCFDIDDVENCSNSTHCLYGQSCFLDKKDVGKSQTVTLGCTDNKLCGTLSNGAAGLVGPDLTHRQSGACHECCSTDNCNKHLCDHSKPANCIDDAKADCAWMNAIFNICQDVHHAKTVCPRFCGLCLLVDGSWADWSVWTACDVTCENGTRTRTRTCTNPPPSNGGLDCAGNNTDVTVCQKQLCPVHGGWSSWSLWDSCSVTCETGIQSRHRSCSNPYPDRSGQYCFGDSVESRLCKPGPCANGGWSSWGTWSKCSVTCGGGLKTRSRTCTNPRPSASGRPCEGDTSHITSCSNDSCYLLVFTVLLNIHTVVSLECFSCSDIDDVENCFNSTHCQYDQSCFLDKKNVGQSQTFTLGCTDNKLCGTLSSGAAGLVGRDVSQRQTDACHECCSTDNCNKHLCEHSKPANCIDDAKADCAWMNTILNLCQDVHHAKTVCPRFCGLCSLVDGSWADWSAWTACDVTCENGTRTRIRTCTNPPPSNGGLDCTGNNTEVKGCQKQLCPVHGGWSSWALWDSCSVTCETGIQSRHRNCSNPYPDRYGDHCFGDSVESRLCKPGPCANGGWSSWGTWTKCSATCGGGVKTRSRTCTNPRASASGRPCEGDTLHITSCLSDSCPSVAFRSRHVTDISLINNQTIVFDTTALNVGNGYDNTTGIFTAPIGGWYSFSIQLCVTSNMYVYYGIMSESTILKQGLLQSSPPTCLAAETVTLVKPGDRVYVKSTSSGKLYQDDLMWNTFSGFLLISNR